MRPLGIPPMPPEESIQLILATLDYWEQYLKSGKAVGGNLADNQGGGGIIEVESLEELYSILAGAPNAGTVQYEVHGLTTLDAARKTLRKQLEALKRGK